jgi:hypothetical protein
MLNTKTINRALFLSNLGLGDHIDMIGAVRYFSQFHNEIHVPCYKHNIKTLSDFYSDDPKIILIPINEDFSDMYWKNPIVNTQLELIEYNPSDYVTVYRSGYCKYPRNITFPDHVIPKCFYMDLGLDPSIGHTYFHIPENLQSKQLYNKIKNIPYIFIQQRSSSTFTPLIRWDINKMLTIDPNVNLYPRDHQWHELASHFVNKPFPHYTDTIIHASELHVVNSSFRCLSAHLPLEATVKKCYARETGEHIPEWTFIRHNPTLPLQ